MFSHSVVKILLFVDANDSLSTTTATLAASVTNSVIPLTSEGLVTLKRVSVNYFFHNTEILNIHSSPYACFYTFSNVLLIEAAA
jgi:hypothetical protein